MAEIIQFLSRNENDTKSFAKKLKEKINSFNIVALCGDLGVGKTTFIKGFLSSFQIDEIDVLSPTFSYLHTFETKNLLFHHFDLYRLKSKDEFLALGFEEYLFKDSVCMIEWPEIIESILPINSTVFIRLEHVDLQTRKIQVEYV